jgi:hypothetical protein
MKPTFPRPDFRAAIPGFSNQRFSSTFAPPLTLLQAAHVEVRMHVLGQLENAVTLGLT